MTRSLLAIALWATGVPVLAAQTFSVAPQAVIVSHSELSSDFEFSGFGVGAALGARRGKFTADIQVFTASLDPAGGATATEPFTLREFDVRATYAVVPALGVLLGASGRQASPDLNAQNVGFIRIGLVSDNALARTARVWARGAYLLAPQFSGRGSAGFAFEIGIGAWLGTANGRWGMRAEYDFQRIDRSVAGADAPIQMLVGKVGVQFGF